MVRPMRANASTDRTGESSNINGKQWRIPMNQNTKDLKQPVSIIPDWIGLVDQSDPDALAAFFSRMPNARTIMPAELDQVVRDAIEEGRFPLMHVALEATQLVVKPAREGNELYYVVGGTHAAYGNFALLWSVRGPGDGVRPRLCFMFWDGEAVLLEAGDAS
jgi:hypothetical protein